MPVLEDEVRHQEQVIAGLITALALSWLPKFLVGKAWKPRRQ